MTCLLVLLFIPTKYYHIISNSMGVMACTRFLLQGKQLHNEESEHCLSCMQHAYWSSSSSLPNILSQTVWELRPAQDFSFRGDNNITKKVRVVSLAQDKHTGPPFLFYQTLSKYVKRYQSHGVQKTGFREENYITKKVRVVSPAYDMPTGWPLHF